ncbi:MAG: type VI secretion system tip protein VgrG [Polyangiaceae bacterium]|nr:type VI secretion system tip protein VgrG [Polyangiaceae bacterium]
MTSLQLTVGSGEALQVTRFDIHETVSDLFEIALTVRTPNPSVDLEAIIGHPASFHVVTALEFSTVTGRTFTGVVRSIEQVQAVVQGGAGVELSTYTLSIVPALWLLTQRKNHRLFLHQSVVEITEKLLKEWSIEPTWKIQKADYPKLELRVQYGESDYDFLCRLWEEAGISFTFPEKNGKSTLVLGDMPHTAAPRAGVPFVDSPNVESEKEYVTMVRLAHEVRPGALAVRDYDFRNPAFAMLAEAPKAPQPEDPLEQFHYMPSGFLVEGGAGGGTPVADDQGVARHDQAFGLGRADRMLLGDRAGKRAVSFVTNVVDLWPGQVFSIENHPHADLPDSQKLLVTHASFGGTPVGEWKMSGRAVFADVRYKPPRRTVKPRVDGVQSAVVVGPAGQEIHTDEFGRVRVQFPWDREGKLDQKSSCWIRVSQGWAGTGYGMIVIPRIGQEVLVGFLNGDPDAPVIVGRVFNATQQVPYKLPENKTRSTWKSDSSMGSGGFNEIMFEDLKGQELVYEQAEKNRRRLVKNDETITVGHDRQKLVKHDEFEKTLGFVKVFIGKDQDIVVKQDKRERVEADRHERVWGNENEQIDGSRSLVVGKDRNEVTGRNHALAVSQELHVKAGTQMVIEAAQDLTLKGPGGFIRINSAGVTIVGNVVKINSGGSANSGKGSSPEAPDAAYEAVTDDVSKSLIGQ